MPACNCPSPTTTRKEYSLKEYGIRYCDDDPKMLAVYNLSTGNTIDCFDIGSEVTLEYKLDGTTEKIVIDPTESLSNYHQMDASDYIAVHKIHNHGASGDYRIIIIGTGDLLDPQGVDMYVLEGSIMSLYSTGTQKHWRMPENSDPSLPPSNLMKIKSDI